MPKFRQVLTVKGSYDFTLEDRQAITKVKGLDHLANKKDCEDFIFEAISNQIMILYDDLALLNNLENQ